MLLLSTSLQKLALISNISSNFDSENTSSEYMNVQNTSECSKETKNAEARYKCAKKVREKIDPLNLQKKAVSKFADLVRVLIMKRWIVWNFRTVREMVLIIAETEHSW